MAFSVKRRHVSFARAREWGGKRARQQCKAWQRPKFTGSASAERADGTLLRELALELWLPFGAGNSCDVAMNWDAALYIARSDTGPASATRTNAAL